MDARKLGVDERTLRGLSDTHAFIKLALNPTAWLSIILCACIEVILIWETGHLGE
jgi:hypothetical protein